MAKTEKRSGIPQETYRYKDQVWRVTKEDAVMVKDSQTGKMIVLGYSHARAWTGCLNAAFGRA